MLWRACRLKDLRLPRLPHVTIGSLWPRHNICPPSGRTVNVLVDTRAILADAQPRCKSTHKLHSHRNAR